MSSLFFILSPLLALLCGYFFLRAWSYNKNNSFLRRAAFMMGLLGLFLFWRACIYAEQTDVLQETVMVRDQYLDSRTSLDSSLNECINDLMDCKDFIELSGEVAHTYDVHCQCPWDPLSLEGMRIPE